MSRELRSPGSVKVGVDIRTPAGAELSIDAKPFATIYRAVLPGWPTDFFIVTLSSKLLHAQTYPSVRAAMRGLRLHTAMSFEGLNGMLGQLGMAMVFDEPPKGEGLVGPDGRPIPPAIVAIHMRNGFEVETFYYEEPGTVCGVMTGAGIPCGGDLPCSLHPEESEVHAEAEAAHTSPDQGAGPSQPERPSGQGD